MDQKPAMEEEPCEVEATVTEDTSESDLPKKKQRKVVSDQEASDRGIIYLSRIPTYMSVKRVRHIFGQYGEVDRIFLQPDEKAPAHKKNRLFSEGWVEFLNKKIAKQVVLTLNNTRVGGKRRSQWYDEIWNMKYLPKFKWGHLNERLAYERAVHQQRMRVEITQAKRETNFFIQNVEKKKLLQRLEKKHQDRGEEFVQRQWVFKQRRPEAEIAESKHDGESSASRLAGKRQMKGNKKTLQRGSVAGKGGKGDTKRVLKKAVANKSFLQTLFSGGVSADGPKT